MPGNKSVLTQAGKVNKYNVGQASNGDLTPFMLAGGGDYLFIGYGHNLSEIAAVWNPNKTDNYYGWLQVEKTGTLFKTTRLHFPKDMVLERFSPDLTAAAGVKSTNVLFDVPGGTKVTPPTVDPGSGAETAGYPVADMPSIAECPVNPED